MSGLLGSTVLEVAIGMAFVYLLLAVFCTTINEWLAGIFKTRGALLKEGILQLLAPGPNDDHPGDKGPILTQFYNHPLIKTLIRGSDHPSYVPARTFATAIMDIATPNQPGSLTFEQLETGLKSLPNSDVKTALLAAIQNTGKDIQAAQTAIEGWYDDAMARVTGWYKRKTQLWIFFIAAAVTVFTNSDTISIARQLWVEPTVRSQIVEAAKNPPKPDATATAVSNETTAVLGRVVGWRATDLSVTPLNWLQRILGWFLTIIAVSLGAPFWFDVLNKFMNLRNAGKSPEEKGKPPEKPNMPPVNP